MRVIIAVFSVVLFLIAAVGLGKGMSLLVDENRARVAASYFPLLIGTIALGFVTVVIGIDQARVDQLAALDWLAEKDGTVRDARVSPGKITREAPSEGRDE